MLGLVYENYLSKYAQKFPKLFLVIFITITTLISFQTINRNSNWKNPLTLYSHDVQKFDNYDIENFLGAELVAANRIDEALIHFKKSVTLLPHDTNLYNVGSVYESLKDYPNAKIYYQQTLNEKSIDYGHSEVRKLAYQGLIKIMLLRDKSEQIDSYLQNAIKEFPDNGTLWAYLAINEYKLNRQESALIAAKKAVKLLPNPTTNKMYERIINKQPIDLKLE